jgi:hypothetical protein
MSEEICWSDLVGLGAVIVAIVTIFTAGFQKRQMRKYLRGQILLHLKAVQTNFKSYFIEIEHHMWGTFESKAKYNFDFLEMLNGCSTPLAQRDQDELAAFVFYFKKLPSLSINDKSRLNEFKSNLVKMIGAFSDESWLSRKSLGQSKEEEIDRGLPNTPSVSYNKTWD